MGRTQGRGSGGPGHWCALLLLCIATPLLGARQTVRTDPHYLIDTWETEDGLPENSATAMVQGEDGYLWLGTFAGLVRFDGAQFTRFDTTNTPALPDDGIVNLHLDRSGRLWVSTFRGLVVREGARWREFGPTDGWTGDFVRTFAERPDGGILLTTFDGKILEYSGGRIHDLARPQGAQGSSYFAHADETGAWWVARDDFVGSWDGRQWVTRADLPPGASGVACGPARDGGMWLVAGCELRKYQHGSLASRTELPELPGGVWKITEDGRGNVWIATHDRGVCRVSPDGSFRRWTTLNGLSYTGTRSVFEDREGQIWVGTNGGGLQRFKPRRVRTVGIEDGLGERLVRSVSPSAGGGVWVGTYGKGLFRWNDGVVTPASAHANQFGYVQSVLTDRAGRTWVGGYGGGLGLLENGTFTRIPPEQTGGGNPVMLFEDSRGHIWIAGGQTVAVFDGQLFRSYTKEEGSPTGEVRFGEDGAGVVWLASRDGVFRYVGGKFTEVRHRDRPIPGVTCLQGDSTGAMWVALANNGFLHWRGETVTRISTGEGLPQCKVRAIIEDDGVFWMPSCRGIMRVRRDELLASADGKTIPALQVLDLEDGLPSLEFPVSNQPICTKDAAGRLWFATAKGAAMLDPAAFSINRVVPPVHVESIVYNTRSDDGVGTAGTSRHASSEVRMTAPFVASPRLPAGSRRLEIHYTAPSSAAASKVKFQVKLDGVDADWQDVGNQRVAYYHSPRPGNYVFRVRAANNDGVGNTQGTSVAFSVEPFLWEATWFRAVVGTALAGAVAGAAWGFSHFRHRRARDRLERARRHSAALLKLYASSAVTSGNVPLAVREICEVSAGALDVERVAVSLVDEAGSGFSSSEVFDRARGGHQAGPTFRAADFPQYFESLQADLAIDAADARRDKRTSELAAAQLLPDGVASVLDVGARAGGRLVGVVRFSHRGKPRRWRDDEIGFSTAVADQLAQAMLNAERERAARELRESEERFRLMADTAPVMIWRTGTNRMCDFLNTTWLRFTGRSPEQEAGAGWAEGIHPDDRQRCLDTYNAAFDARAEFQMEYRLRRYDGQYRWIVDTGVPRMGPDGRFAGYVGSCIDVTERKQADESVRQSQAQFRQVFEAAPCAMLMVGEDGRITLANEQAERMFGYSAAELLGMTADRLTPESFRAPAGGDPRGIFAGSEIPAPGLHDELVGLRRDGTEFPIDVSVSQISGTSGSFVLSTIIDLTARKRAEVEAQQQRNELTHLSRVTMLGELSGSLAHELNQPLAAILSNAQAAQRFLARDDFDVGELRDILKDIVDEDKRAGEVIRRLRLLLKKGEINRQPLDLNEVVLDVLKIVRSDLVNRDVVAETELAADVPAVMGDRVQVQQVLLNLLTNACDAVSENVNGDRSVVVRTRLCEDSSVRVSVVDRGAGISPERLENIFEPFVTTKSHGMGLGLAVCRTIVTAHGGTLSAANNADRGARFDMILPTGSTS